MKSIVSIVFLLPLALPGCGEEAATPDSGPSADAVQEKKPVAPLIPKAQMLDWCKEHGVPESICTRCDESLSAGYKDQGDWCEDHALPDSQCFDCHPELEAEFKAKAPSGS